MYSRSFPGISERGFSGELSGVSRPDNFFKCRWSLNVSVFVGGDGILGSEGGYSSLWKSINSPSAGPG